MNRLRTTAALAAIVLVLAACGPAASGDSGAPSSEASSEASVAASQAQPSEDGAAPSFTEGAVADLEALIPDSVGDLTIQKQSMQGSEFLTAPGSDPATIQFVQDLGVSPSDISIAIGFGFSADASASLVMFVFRAAGADTDRLVSAFKQASDSDGGTPLEWSSETVAGKQVEVADDGGSTTYLYATGDLLIFLTASDPATAEEVIGGLP